MNKTKLEYLYSLLPKGHNNGLRLFEIAYKFLKGERATRQLFEDMTHSDLPVINMMDGKGYFRPATKAELIAYKNIIHSYKCALGRKEYHLGVALEKMDGTQTYFNDNILSEKAV